MLLQELKVLFLRTRNNSDALYWSIIKEIYKRQTFAESKTKGTFAKVGIFFNSLRDKYNRALKDLVEPYRSKYRYDYHYSLSISIMIYLINLYTC